jgi:hypothetical protein
MLGSGVEIGDRKTPLAKSANATMVIIMMAKIAIVE